MKDFFSTAEVAERLGLTAQRVADLANAGRIPSVRHGRCIRIPARAWEQFVEAQTREAMDSLRTAEGKGERHAAIA